MQNLNELVKQINSHDIITIFGHIYPDGDCYGSQIGLKELIKENFKDKKVYAIGSGFKKLFNVISPMDEINDEDIKKSLAIIVDCSTFDRIEDQRFLLAQDKFMIDHHIRSTNFEPSIIVEEAISATEIITDIAINLNWKFNVLSSSALLLGLITDGGRFLYTPSVNEFNVAKLLLNNNAKINEIYDALYETTLEDFSFKGYYYSHFIKGNGFLYIIFRKKELEKLNVNASKAATSLNLLSSCKGYPIWASFAENEDGTFKAEFRCKKPYEVVSLALAHNGGGHPCASGCTLNSYEEINLVLKELENLYVKQL